MTGSLLILRTERVLDKVSLKVLEELEHNGFCSSKIELVTMIDAIEAFAMSNPETE